MRVHGGDREAKIDLSSNINPLGPPSILIEALTNCTSIDIIKNYPDYRYKDLRTSIAEFYNCDPENVIPTNGAAEAINLVVLTIKPKKIVVLEPSYGEYEDIARALEIEYEALYYRMAGLRFYIDPDDLAGICKNKEILIIITNPNNPTGSYTPIDVLVKMLKDCKAKVLIDEAYVELCTQCPIEIAKDLPKNFVIVRSLTKWLAVPGLRIGLIYASDEELIKRIDILRQPWNVNSIAECVIIKILKQKKMLIKFIEDSRRYIELERARISKVFEKLGFKVFESVTNFLLVDLGFDADEVISKLKRRGIAVRSCKDFKGLGPNYIRVAIKSANENDKFVKILTEVLHNIKNPL